MSGQTRAHVSMSPLLAVVKKLPHKEEFWKQQEAAQISGHNVGYSLDNTVTSGDIKDVDPRPDQDQELVFSGSPFLDMRPQASPH